ncbi:MULTISPECIES: NAD(P)H-hydrate dehydratase [unclassified Moraxella]|uniref:NAD(P)H-hydrate dehydratase n=1 Tax=unclassified Moraxella TaxID=2685852 RepID=UPI003AF61186
MIPKNFPTAIPCYSPTQIYELETNWFQTNDSFGLMQQASWQMAHWIKSNFANAQQSVLIAVGRGNNGGDGWGVAYFLTKLCPNWQICVIEVAPPTTDNAQQAKALFNGKVVQLSDFLNSQKTLSFHVDIILDGLFGIGLNKTPIGDFANMIDWINGYKSRFNGCQVIAIDVPSGLNATDGKVYDKLAVKADITLCLIARKVGLHLQDAKDYVGQVVDLPMIPIDEQADIFYHTQFPTLPKRLNNSHKGDYGHVLIIGGNQLEIGKNQGNGMAGASLLSAKSAFAVGAGKVTVACYANFHNAIITALPNAMTADLHHQHSVCELIKNVDVVAIGMGLGRDEASFSLFCEYLQCAISHDKICVIDADGLYHLVTLSQNQNSLSKFNPQKVYLTPHASEAGRLLNTTYQAIDNDKIGAIQQLTEQYGGTWLIKGSQTLVLEHQALHICGLGNTGMATAGMGDVLSGVVAGLLAQSDNLNMDYPLLWSVLLHARVGDELARKMGEYALSANEMAMMISETMG